MAYERDDDTLIFLIRLKVRLLSETGVQTGQKSFRMILSIKMIYQTGEKVPSSRECNIIS